METRIGYFQWYKEASEAVDHLDAAPAYFALRHFDEALEQAPPEERNSPEFLKDTQTLKRELLVVAFPALSTEEAKKIISGEVLAMVKRGMNLDRALETRHAFIPYGDHEEDRRALKEALLSNQGKIGQYSIGVWLKNFDAAYDPITRDSKAIFDFFRTNPKVARLSKNEQVLLRNILIAYENWLAAYRLNEVDVAELYRKGKKFKVGTKVIIEKKSSAQAPIIANQDKQVTNLPLLEALSKYQQLASKQITGEKIKLKTQVEPVRPTLMNWLKYYRSELGIGYHDATQRGEFLYRSENGRKLTSEERERLNLILKSIEEEYPLEIDTVRSEIIFPEFQEMAPKRVPERRLASSPLQKSASPPPEQKPKSLPVAPKPSNFSFHQGLPPTRDLPPVKPISRIAEPSHPSFGFQEMPQIKGMKSAPAFAELRHGEPAFRERESASTSLQRDGRSKPAFPDLEPAPGGLRGSDRSRVFWKPSLSQAASEPTNLSFSSPHVFPEEKERRENWLKQKVAPKRDLPATPRTAPPLQSPAVPQPTAKPAVPPLAPRRSPDLPRPKQYFVPNRFNITPMGYHRDDE